MKNFPIFFIFIFLFSCADYEKNKILKKESRIYYSSTGFALIYEDSLYKNKIINKKIDNEKNLLLHSTLKRNTPIQITNLKNSKSIELKVYKKANYPKIFNVGNLVDLINYKYDIEVFAKECGTISNEILTSISNRVKRVYIN